MFNLGRGIVYDGVYTVRTESNSERDIVVDLWLGRVYTQQRWRGVGAHLRSGAPNNMSNT